MVVIAIKRKGLEMWYLILSAVFALWVLVDARGRMNNVLGWPIATFLLGPLMLPVYVAKRNLKGGEVREGGTAWNIMKNFALFWTVFMVVVGIQGIIGVSDIAQQSTTSAEQTGVAIGATLGLGMIFFLWLLVIIAALVLGLFLKKSTMVEKGPTGPLAKQTSS